MFFFVKVHEDGSLEEFPPFLTRAPPREITTLHILLVFWCCTHNTITVITVYCPLYLVTRPPPAIPINWALVSIFHQTQAAIEPHSSACQSLFHGKRIYSVRLLRLPKNLPHLTLRRKLKLLRSDIWENYGRARGQVAAARSPSQKKGHGQKVTSTSYWIYCSFSRCPVN